MEEKFYICADRPRSTPIIFGLVVEGNRVDVVVESGPLQLTVFEKILCQNNTDES